MCLKLGLAGKHTHTHRVSLSLSPESELECREQMHQKVVIWYQVVATISRRIPVLGCCSVCVYVCVYTVKKKKICTDLFLLHSRFTEYLVYEWDAISIIQIQSDKSINRCPPSLPPSLPPTFCSFTPLGYARTITLTVMLLPLLLLKVCVLWHILIYI